MDENGFLPAAEIWGSIKTKIKSISSILNLVGSELGQTAEYDEDEFLKVELGYTKNTDIIKIERTDLSKRRGCRVEIHSRPRTIEGEEMREEMGKFRLNGHCF